MNVQFTNRQFIESLPGGVWLAKTLNDMISAVNAGWNTQHQSDGTHGVVTATSVRTPIHQVGSVTNAPTITSGPGSPESLILAVQGSLYLRTDGGAATSLYVKETGNGATRTGWVAK